GVVHLAAPALDQGAVVDAVPGEAAEALGQSLEELKERVGVVFVEGTDEEAPSVTQDDLLGKAFRHARVLRKRNEEIAGRLTQATLPGSRRYATPHERPRVGGALPDAAQQCALSVPSPGARGRGAPAGAGGGLDGGAALPRSRPAAPGGGAPRGGCA